MISAPTPTAPFPLLGATATPLATAEASGGAFEAFRLDLQPGARSPRHTLSAAKLFVVLAGTVVLTHGDDDHVAHAGEALLVAAGTPHAYRNDSGAAAALQVVVAGEGQLRFLRGMSALTAGGAPDADAVRRHAAEHGVAFVPA